MWEMEFENKDAKIHTTLNCLSFHLRIMRMKITDSQININIPPDLRLLRERFLRKQRTNE